MVLFPIRVGIRPLEGLGGTTRAPPLCRGRRSGARVSGRVLHANLTIGRKRVDRVDVAANAECDTAGHSIPCGILALPRIPPNAPGCLD
eukprot:scaffold9973_cov125-Isochrysis_galbana.AAC.1